MVSPIRRFSPAPGITVDVTGRSIFVTGRMEVWGSHATADNTAEITKTINRIWTQTFADGFTIQCSVTASLRPAKVPASSSALQIEVTEMDGPSNVFSLGPFIDKRMQLNTKSPAVFTWVAAHEFGHVLGMADRYSETVISKLCSGFGCKRDTTIERGYEGTLMGEHEGAMNNQTLTDLDSETASEPWWINDDNEVRAWINNHSAQQLADLFVSHKIGAINTLMSGWISDEDVEAIKAILRSVTTSGAAAKIRAAVDPLNFTSIGQRTQIRIAMDNMPR